MSLKVKTDYKGDIRIVRQPGNSIADTLNAIRQHCKDCYGFKDVNQFDLRYLDEENDWVTITTTQDVQDAFACAKAKGLKALKVSIAAKDENKKDEEEKIEDNEERERTNSSSSSSSSSEEIEQPQPKTFCQEIRENEEFRNELILMIQDFLNFVRNNEERDLTAAFVTSLDSHEMIKNHTDFTKYSNFLNIAINKIQPYALFIAAIDPSYVKEMVEFIVKKMENCGPQNAGGPQGFGGCGMLNLLPMLGMLQGAIGGPPSFGGFPLFAPPPPPPAPFQNPGHGPPFHHRHPGHRHPHGRGHGGCPRWRGNQPTPGVEISEVKAPRCVCGDQLSIMEARECYGKVKRCPAKYISCDVCGLKCDSLTKVWHCPRGKSSDHPGGYDICFECNQGSKDGVLCLCGATMVERTGETAYLGSVESNNNNAGAATGQVGCDRCQALLTGDTPVYHCKNENSTMHPGGYDICLECAEKMSAETQGFDGPPPPPLGFHGHPFGMPPPPPPPHHPPHFAPHPFGGPSPHHPPHPHHGHGPPHPHHHGHHHHHHKPHHRWFHGGKCGGGLRHTKEGKTGKLEKKLLTKEGLTKAEFKKEKKCMKHTEKLQAKREKLENKLQKVSQKLEQINTIVNDNNDENNEFVIENNNNVNTVISAEIIQSTQIQSQQNNPSSEISVEIIDESGEKIDIEQSYVPKELHCQSATEAIKVEEPLYPNLENQEIIEQNEKENQNEIKPESGESKPESQSQNQAKQAEVEPEADEDDDDREPLIVSNLPGVSHKKKSKRAYRFQQQLQQLLEFGFDENKAKAALEQHNGDVSRATNFLLG